MDSLFPIFRPGFDWLGFEATRNAAKQAYEQAELTNPRKEIGVGSVPDCFTIAEMIIYEDLGFSPRGRAKEDIDSGSFTLQGDLPVNIDGGLRHLVIPLEQASEG